MAGRKARLMTEPKARNLLIIWGVIFSLVGDLLFSWFTIDYHPAGTLFTYHIEYDIFAQIQFLGSGVPIASLKEFYISLGCSLLLAYVYSLNIKTEWLKSILNNFITQSILNVTNIATLFYAVYVNVANKSIIRSFSPSFLQTFFGTTDRNYVLQNSTATLQVGFYLAVVGCLVTAAGVYATGTMLITTPRWVYTLLIATVILGCCGFGTFNIVQGNDWSSNNDFYINAHHFTIAATQGWQDTQLSLLPGDEVWILYLPHTGLWTADKAQPEYTDASGGAAPAVSGSAAALPLPDISRQALIGKIGNAHAFAIGNGISFLSFQAGPLQLRMNQADSLLKDDAGQIDALIYVYRFLTGRTIAVHTVTLNASQDWQDTGIPYEDGDDISISYIFGSGTWSNSDSIVAANGQNGTPPSWLFIERGVYNGAALPPVQSGLIAKLGQDPAFYCGFSIIARNVGTTSDTSKNADLFLKLNASGLSAGSIKVAVVTLHQDTVSTIQYV